MLYVTLHYYLVNLSIFEDYSPIFYVPWLWTVQFAIYGLYSLLLWIVQFAILFFLFCIFLWYLSIFCSVTVFCSSFIILLSMNFINFIINFSVLWAYKSCLILFLCLIILHSETYTLSVVQYSKTVQYYTLDFLHYPLIHGVYFISHTAICDIQYIEKQYNITL